MATTVGQSLQDAINDFQGALTPDQKRELQQIKTVPDATAVITFTAQLDRANPERRGSSIGSRLYSLLQSVQQFSSVVDNFVSSHPNVAALVWGAVKLTMNVSSDLDLQGLLWLPLTLNLDRRKLHLLL